MCHPGRNRIYIVSKKTKLTLILSQMNSLQQGNAQLPYLRNADLSLGTRNVYLKHEYPLK